LRRPPPNQAERVFGNSETIRVKLFITGYHVAYRNNWWPLSAQRCRTEQRMTRYLLSREKAKPTAADLVVSLSYEKHHVQRSDKRAEI